MHISVFMGPFARGPRDDHATIAYCLKQAEDAARAGFSMVTFGEQHFNNYEPYCNPLLMAARLSPVLGDTWFGTTICPLVFHNPIRLAEDINVIDNLLGGKLIVGLSAGRVGFTDDFENFNLDPNDQRAIFADKYAALMKLWAHKAADGPLKFDSPWVNGTVSGRLMPISYRAPHPNIAIGTNTDAVVRQAGLDGNHIFLGPCGLASAAAKFQIYTEALVEAGFDAAIRTDRLKKSMVHHQVIVGKNDDEAWSAAEGMAGRNPLLNRSDDTRSLRAMSDDSRNNRQGMSAAEIKNSAFVDAWIMAGSPDTVIAVLKAHENVGIQQVHTRFTVGMYNPPAWDNSFRLFVDEVMPNIGARTFDQISVREIQPEVTAGPLPPGAPPIVDAPARRFDHQASARA